MSNSSKTKFLKYHQEYLHTIQERNKAFSRLSRKNRIIALCQDAIYNILIGSILPKQGSYIKDILVKEEVQDKLDTVGMEYTDQAVCSFMSQDKKLKKHFNPKIDMGYRQLQSVLPIVECQTCAKGAMMVSAISFKNKITVNGAYFCVNGSLPDILKREFVETEWAIIELCFEGWNIEDEFCSGNSQELEKFTKQYSGIGDIKYKTNDKYGFFMTFDYGKVYAYKHLKVEEIQSNFDNNYSPDPTALLLQICCAIIANGGDVLKALSIDNETAIDYKGIIWEAYGKYPGYKSKKEILNEIGPALRMIRQTPVSMDKIKKETLKRVKERFDNAELNSVYK